MSEATEKLRRVIQIMNEAALNHGDQKLGESVLIVDEVADQIDALLLALIALVDLVNQADAPPIAELFSAVSDAQAAIARAQGGAA